MKLTNTGKTIQQIPQAELKLDKYSEPELAKILIDVEAQKDEYTGYDLPIRGIFYCSRMISSQLGQEFNEYAD